jgi:hypothetical protein
VTPLEKIFIPAMTVVTQKTSNSTNGEDEDRPCSHFDDAPDGCGGAEIWEFAAERREQSRRTGAAKGNGK